MRDGDVGRQAGSGACGALALVLVTAVLTVPGCGGSDKTSTEIWCDGLCEAVQRCRFEDPDCHSECVKQRPGLANERVSTAEAEGSCLATLSCQTLIDTTAWRTAIDGCWEDAKQSVAITDHIREFCAGYSLAWFECGYSLPVEDCERVYGRWTDAVLDRLARCQSQASCDDFPACQDAVWDSI